MPIATVLFYANIALFWAQVLLILCRIHSQKMRIAIIFGQTIALVLNYPFLLDEVTQRYLGALSALNFSYTHIQWACTPPSSTCQVLQALW
jgi:Mg2+/citrate symporter